MPFFGDVLLTSNHQFLILLIRGAGEKREARLPNLRTHTFSSNTLRISFAFCLVPLISIGLFETCITAVYISFVAQNSVLPFQKTKIIFLCCSLPQKSDSCLFLHVSEKSVVIVEFLFEFYLARLSILYISCTFVESARIGEYSDTTTKIQIRKTARKSVAAFVVDCT